MRGNGYVRKIASYMSNWPFAHAVMFAHIIVKIRHALLCIPDLTCLDHFAGVRSLWIMSPVLVWSSDKCAE